jgi:hypothetical protein
LIHEVSRHRNNDSPALSFGFNHCAEGSGTRVFAQAGPKAEVQIVEVNNQFSPLAEIHQDQPLTGQANVRRQSSPVLATHIEGRPSAATIPSQ